MRHGRLSTRCSLMSQIERSETKPSTMPYGNTTTLSSRSETILDSTSRRSVSLPSGLQSRKRFKNKGLTLAPLPHYTLQDVGGYLGLHFSTISVIAKRIEAARSIQE